MEFTKKLKRIDKRHLTYFVWETKAGCMTECPDVFQSNRQFTSAIDLLKAVNVYCSYWSSFWISDAKEKNDVLYQAKKFPNMVRNIITGHFTITTGKLGEKPTCVVICFVTKPTKPIEWNLYLSILKFHCMKRATGVSALSTICIA